MNEPLAKHSAGPSRLDSAEVLQAFFEVSPVPFAISRRDGSIVDANAALCELLGLRREGLSGLRTQDFHADPSERERLVQRMVQQGQLEGEVIRLRRADGRLLWCSLSARAVKRGSRAVFFSVWSDITEKVVADNALRLREYQLGAHNRALVELSTSGLLSSGDLDAVAHSITEVCARTLEVARCSLWLIAQGAGRADGQGGAAAELDAELHCAARFDRREQVHSSAEEVDPRDAPRDFQALQDCRIQAVAPPAPAAPADTAGGPHTTAGESFQLLDAPVRVDGVVRGVLRHEHLGPLRPWTSEEQNFAATMTDMVALAIQARDRLRAEGERAALAEEVQRAQKLKALGHMAAAVADDTDHLLRLIEGHARAAVDADPEQQREHLQAIQDAVRRGSELTRRLHAFGGRQVMAEARLDLARHLRDRLPLLREVAGPRVHLELDLEPEMPTLHADPAQIDQIVLHLCRNASEAMPDGGKLSIRARRLDAESAEDDPTTWLVLEVEDDGQGMDAELARRCFDPFFTTHAQAGRQGIGLSIVHGAVHQHGGRIEVHSQPDQGSRFRLLLPLRRPGSPNGKAAHLAAPRGSILLLEAEPAASRRAAQILQHAGYRVLVTAQAEEAIATFDAHQDEVSLLLLGSAMPEDGGKEVRQHVARHRELRVLRLEDQHTASELLRAVEKAFPRRGISHN